MRWGVVRGYQWVPEGAFGAMNLVIGRRTVRTDHKVAIQTDATNVVNRDTVQRSVTSASNVTDMVTTPSNARKDNKPTEKTEVRPVRISSLQGTVNPEQKWGKPTITRKANSSLYRQSNRQKKKTKKNGTKATARDPSDIGHKYLGYLLAETPLNVDHAEKRECGRKISHR